MFNKKTLLNVPTELPEIPPCIKFSSSSTFSIKNNWGSKLWNGTLYYSYDAETWTEWNGTNEIASHASNVIYMRGKNNTKITGDAGLNTNYFIITGTNVKCEGNIETLLDWEVVENGEHPVMADYCFKTMFNGCEALITAPSLPATTLTNGCYQSMFSSTSITTPPELPATVLRPYCYKGMFAVTPITTAPSLPALTAELECYSYMFSGCTNLVVPPSLPATTLLGDCYSYMFNACYSLSYVPALPATNLYYECYMGMFRNCTSIVSAPTLPDTVIYGCYRNMFEGCTSLVNAPALRATELKAYCYYEMFKGCTALVNPPVLLATSIPEYSEYSCTRMFDGCTHLASAPTLSSTTLWGNCYEAMFRGCSSLVTPPSLPATTVRSSCYKEMFKNCTSLTSVPKLPATDLTELHAQYAYMEMFYGCSSLYVSDAIEGLATKAWTLPETGVFDANSTGAANMFYGCLGTRAHNHLPSSPGSSVTYYTQNEPV